MSVYLSLCVLAITFVVKATVPHVDARRGILKIKFAIASIFALGLVMQSSFAADLEQDMKVLEKNYRTFKKTNSQQEAVIALTTMQQAALDAKKSTPKKLVDQPENSPQVQGYRKGLDHLVLELNQTLTLVKEGKLQQAQVQAIPAIDAIKKENHKKFR